MKKGQSLVEIVMAIGVMSLVLTALAGAITKSISNSTASRQQSEANQYLSEVMDWVRVERDASFVNVYGKASPTGAGYCMDSTVWPEVAPLPPDPNCTVAVLGTTEYYRWINLYTHNADGVAGNESIRVEGKVKWTTSRGEKRVESAVILTPWQAGGLLVTSTPGVGGEEPPATLTPTPIPTNTPVPTNTPTPTATPAPGSPTLTNTPVPTPTTAPPTLTSLKCIAETASIEVGYTAVTGASSYNIQRCTGISCINFASIGNSTALFYSDTTAASGFTYRYRVRAKIGAVFTGWSNYLDTTVECY